jgi:hypothetical protein
MDLDQAQVLLGVPRFVSQKDLRKKYLSLIKIHHPDVNADKKRSNKLTADIIEAFEYLNRYREAERWAEVDLRGAQQESKREPQNNRNQKKYPDDDWESEIINTPLDLNPFWDSTSVSNYDILPECFYILEIKNRFPDKNEILELYGKLIQRHHPSNNSNDTSAYDKCKYIHLAYFAAISIRDQEGWLQESSRKSTDSSNEENVDSSESSFQSASTNSRNENFNSDNIEPSVESKISLSSFWWPNTPGWFKVVSIIALLALVHYKWKPEIWAKTEYGRKKWVAEVINGIVANEFTEKHKITIRDVEFEIGESDNIRTGRAYLTVEPFFENRKIAFKSTQSEVINDGKRVYQMSVEMLDGFTIYEQPEVKQFYKAQEERERMFEQRLRNYLRGGFEGIKPQTK